MAKSVSVIIPTLNEETTVAAAIQSAFAAGAFEVIVTDGGSTDGTEAAARAAGALFHQCDNLRGKQMNCGAREANGDAVLFLHADTLLPEGACAMVTNALENGSVFGGFQIEFIERHLRLRVVAFMINLRTRWTLSPWGDQGQFMVRERFLQSGGYREYPIMEDYEMAFRMRAAGRSIVLPARVSTSGRRFLQKGVLQTAMINWRLVFAFRRGADPRDLAKTYRR